MRQKNKIWKVNSSPVQVQLKKTPQVQCKFNSSQAMPEFDYDNILFCYNPQKSGMVQDFHKPTTKYNCNMEIDNSLLLCSNKLKKKKGGV